MEGIDSGGGQGDDLWTEIEGSGSEMRGVGRGGRVGG